METDADKLAEEAFRAMAEVGKLRAENARLMVAKMPTSEDYNRIIGEREALRAINSELLSALRDIASGDINERLIRCIARAAIAKAEGK